MAAFWKLALGYVDESPPEPFDTHDEWLESLGVPEDEWDQAAWLCDPDETGPRIAILGVPEPKTAKNRLHLDLRVSASVPRDKRWSAISAEVERLTAAGATVLEEFSGHHVVMADPEGNEFCVC